MFVSEPPDKAIAFLVGGRLAGCQRNVTHFIYTLHSAVWRGLK
jgi:hypothetical protein